MRPTALADRGWLAYAPTVMNCSWRIKGLSLALVALLAATLPPAGASAATRLGEAFLIFPARHYLLARPPVKLPPTTVANTTRSTLRVEVFPVLLAQMPSGAFTFDTSPAGLRRARRLLDALPRSFELGPGSSRLVGLRWYRLPPRVRTAALGVIYRATPPAGRATVRIAVQLLGVNLLRLPGRYRLTGRLTGVHVTQAGRGTLRFVLDVKNTGQAAASPSRLLLTVRNRYRALLLRRRLPSDIVLPGVTREFVLDVKHRLPAGSYTMRGQATFGSTRRLQAVGRFELTGPNELPTSAIEVGSLSASGTIGQGATVRAVLHNAGSMAGSTAIDLSLYRLVGGVPGQRPIASSHVVSGRVAPGTSSRFEFVVGRLQRGTYRLLASYVDSTGTPQTIVADFEALSQPGILARIRGFEREHLILVPLLILLVCGAVIVLMALRGSHLKRALAESERRRS